MHWKEEQMKGSGVPKYMQGTNKNFRLKLKKHQNRGGSKVDEQFSSPRQGKSGWSLSVLVLPDDLKSPNCLRGLAGSQKRITHVPGDGLPLKVITILCGMFCPVRPSCSWNPR